MKYIKEIIPYLIIILVVILIRTFIITPVQVDGISMYPTLNDNEILILKKYDTNYKRFDIVVLDYNNNKLIKRIIGLPKEHIKYKDNKLYINGKVILEDFKTNTETSDFELDEIIPNDCYFVMGDNRGNSTDSRIIGVINKKDIKGKIGIAIFPLNKFGKVK